MTPAALGDASDPDQYTQYGGVLTKTSTIERIRLFSNCLAISADVTEGGTVDNIVLVMPNGDRVSLSYNALQDLGPVATELVERLWKKVRQ